MITPEFAKTETGNYVLVANHFVETEQSLELSIAFNRARIRYAEANLPQSLSKCTLVYDVRGQNLLPETVEIIRAAFSDIFELKVIS
jgi:hypothetical protein